MAYCSNCGAHAADGATYCASCGHALTLPAASRPDAAPPPASPLPDVVYAGFIRRWIALWIDQLILALPVLVVAVALAVVAGAKARQADDGLITGAVYLAYWLFAPLYYALQESSAAQATLGKRALGIKVTDLQGRRLSFGRALGRWFSAALSYLTLYIGFLMAAFTQRKQALHDVVAGTLVVDKYAFTDQPQRQQRHLSGCLIALVVGVFLILPLAGILAAIALPAYNSYRIRAAEGACLAEAKAYMNQAVAAGLSEQPIPTPPARACAPSPALTRADIDAAEIFRFQPKAPGVAATLCRASDATCRLQSAD